MAKKTLFSQSPFFNPITGEEDDKSVQDFVWMYEYKLSKIQLGELKEAFALFDNDEKGMQPKVFGTALRAIGQNPSEKCIAALLTTAKTNSEGRIELEEFLQLTQKYKLREESDMQKDLIEAFRYFDRSGNGTLNVKELKEALATLGEPLERADIKHLLQLAGAEGGQINYQNLIKKLCAEGRKMYF